MYLGRFNLFECDSCHKQEYADPFPAGWIFLTSMKLTKHHCLDCQTPAQKEKCEKDRQIMREHGHTVHT